MAPWDEEQWHFKFVHDLWEIFNVDILLTFSHSLWEKVTFLNKQIEPFHIIQIFTESPLTPGTSLLSVSSLFIIRKVPEGIKIIRVR